MTASLSPLVGAIAIAKWDLGYPASEQQIDEALTRIEQLLSPLPEHEHKSLWQQLTCRWLSEVESPQRLPGSDLLFYCWQGLTNKGALPTSNHRAKPGLIHLWASGPKFFLFPSAVVHQMVEHDLLTGRWEDGYGTTGLQRFKDAAEEVQSLGPKLSPERSFLLEQLPILQATLENALLKQLTAQGNPTRPRM